MAEQVTELTGGGVPILDPDAPGERSTSAGSGPTPTYRVAPGHAAQVEIRRGWDRQPQVRVTHWCTDPTPTGTSSAGTSPPTGPRPDSCGWDE